MIVHVVDQHFPICCRLKNKLSNFFFKRTQNIKSTGLLFSSNCQPYFRASSKFLPNKAAWCINFLGIQPTFTQVPPKPVKLIILPLKINEINRFFTPSSSNRGRFNEIENCNFLVHVGCFLKDQQQICDKEHLV